MGKSYILRYILSSALEGVACLTAQYGYGIRCWYEHFAQCIIVTQCWRAYVTTVIFQSVDSRTTGNSDTAMIVLRNREDGTPALRSRPIEEIGIVTVARRPKKKKKKNVKSSAAKRPLRQNPLCLRHNKLSIAPRVLRVIQIELNWADYDQDGTRFLDGTRPLVAL